MSDVSIQLDESNRDVLFARRVELFFEPSSDGTESLSGKVVWHTEWWHYSGELLRGQSMGPRIERRVPDIVGEAYPVGEETLPALAVIGALKAAFIQHAHEHLGLTEPEE